MQQKLETLRDIFGVDTIKLTKDELTVGDQHYPIIDDVIILLNPAEYPASVRNRLKKTTVLARESSDFALDIQFTFGQEWQAFDQIIPEHEQEFKEYFDLINLKLMHNQRVCDLGCGSGRWSHFIAPHCRELILVDFSDAIFVARRNLADNPNTLFFMADIAQLPFRADFADFIFCLGVLHHMPDNALMLVRKLSYFAPKLLVYLYYALDNRPWYFRRILWLTTVLRHQLARYQNPKGRQCLTTILTLCLYMPWVLLARLVAPLKLDHYVPLSYYQHKTFARIRQDCYDRFFTRIEQRFSQKQILELQDTYSRIQISPHVPYWHFMCER